MLIKNLNIFLYILLFKITLLVYVFLPKDYKLEVLITTIYLIVF